MSTAEEVEAGRKRNEYFANLETSRPQPKAAPNGEGSGAVLINTGIVAPETPKQPQVKGIKPEVPSAECSLAPTVVSEAAAPATNIGGATPTGTHSEQQLVPNASQASGALGDRSGKPTPLPPEFANFPAELTSLPNWVLWRYLPPKSDGAKWLKVPFRPNGKPASTTDRSTWSGFEACRTAYARGGFDGVGFVFDGEVGPDGLCYCGVDLDTCVDGKKIQSLAESRIKLLNTYTELSVSGTGMHCIVRAKPLERIVKFDGVEIYTGARYFTFTGHSLGEKIKAANTEICALVDDVRAKEAAARQQQQSGLSATDLADPFKNGPAQAFAAVVDPQESLADGIRTIPWFETLTPELKDNVIDYALGVIAKNSQLLELEANGGNNAEYYKLTTSVARSGAPNAEDIFVKHASSVKNADPSDALRRHFSRCRASQPSGNREITVGTLLLLAQQNGANFDQWKCQAPRTPSLSPANWSAAGLQVSFTNIPHRHWLYGTYLVRGEITVLAAPGGAGKTALATGIAVEVAAGNAKLGEQLWRNSDQKVLYLSGEEGGAEITRRIYAFCKQHNISEKDVARLSVAAADDPRVQSTSLLGVNEKATVLNEAGFKSLQSALEQLRPDLLVLDPLVVFCGGGDMNGTIMSLVMRKLKALAVLFDCAMLIVHHTRKGRPGSDDPAEQAERISGAAAIVNLARRALMPVTMSETEAKLYSVLPSQRFQFFKLVDAKSNLAPLSAEARWYELVSEELPNSEPPIYPNGDRVQAVKRARLTRQNATSSLEPEQLVIRFELMKLIDEGLVIDGKKVPYSPNSTGNNKRRAILERAMAAVGQATPDREWYPRDLRATVERELEALKRDGWVIVEKIKNGRFRRSHGLRQVWERTPWAKERKTLQQHGGPTIRTEQEQCELMVSEMADELEIPAHGQLVNDPVN
jgi:AAA domain